MATAEKYIQKVVDELVKHGYDAKRMEVTQGSDLLVRIIPLDYAEMEKELSHLRTTAELAGKMEWLPIETATKDSTNILLLFADKEISVGYWDVFYAEGGRGYEGGLAWIEPVSGERLDMMYDPPIAWMPLPKSLADIQKAKGGK